MEAIFCRAGATLLAPASIVCLLLVSGTPALKAEESSTTTCNCSVIDRMYQAQYMELERISTSIPDGETKPDVWLRLRNNSSCPILFCAYGLNARIVQGRLVDHLVDGEEACIHYYNQAVEQAEWVQRYESRPSVRTDHYWVVRLLPGDSALFSVPGSNFKEGYLVAVPFAYEWEGSSSIDLRSPQHWVVYGADQLPRDAREKLSIRTAGPIE